MKKFSALMMAALAVLALSEMANAQSGFDAFGGMKTLVVQSPSNILYSASSSGITNQAVDLRLFTGIVKIDLMACTNVPGTVVGGCQVSTDNTNWTALQNYAIANPTTFNYTNTYYGSAGTIVTNTFNLDGTNTTPTASTAGFASYYFNPSPFTNAAATITLASPNAITTIAFRVDDAPRYLRTFWNTGGTGTNVTVAAVLTGRASTSSLRSY